MFNFEMTFCRGTKYPNGTDDLNMAVKDMMAHKM